MPLSICVYCSASNNIQPEYFQLAADLGKAIAARGDTLVYGGATVGLMGEIARNVQEGGGRVVGIIPQSLVEHEIAYQNADELIVTNGFRERKAMMEERADAFITLPGGLGTLEELFEIMNLRQLRLINKPLVMLNHNGFYDPLSRLLEHMQEANFVRVPLHSLCYFSLDVPDTFTYIDKWQTLQIG
ncbi:MAG TPA: TIGR00730 family Rossman fold protein [Oceanobacillus sp.]|nr:TIGR00730 family Rossman fold protein [Oceanobacillus sp.]